MPASLQRLGRVAELGVERAVPERAGDDHVESGQHEQNLEHNQPRATRGSEQDHASDDTDEPDQNASEPLHRRDVHDPSLHDKPPMH